MKKVDWKILNLYQSLQLNMNNHILKTNKTQFNLVVNINALKGGLATWASAPSTQGTLDMLTVQILTNPNFSHRCQLKLTLQCSIFNDVKWSSSLLAQNTQNKIWWWHGAQGRQLESQFQVQILPPLLAILKGIWKTRLNVIQNLTNSNEGSLGC